MQDAETGLALGRLQAQAEETTRQLGAIFRRLKELMREIHEQAGTIKTLTLQSAAQQTQIAAIEPVVADYKSLKLKGFGVLGVVALLGSGAGAGITNVVRMFLSGAP